MKNKLEPIPEVGKYYHFFDDGKISPGRHYICKCERIITVEEAKNIMIEVPNEYIDGVMDIISLYEHWHDNATPNHDWLYSEDTDYFIECSCPEYDENNLWFVRTKDDGWFSMDIQNFWQAGSLDVTGKRYQHCIDSWGDDNWKKKYPPADEEHYKKRF
jgi:hypothetical protein